MNHWFVNFIICSWTIMARVMISHRPPSIIHPHHQRSSWTRGRCYTPQYLIYLFVAMTFRIHSPSLASQSLSHSHLGSCDLSIYQAYLHTLRSSTWSAALSTTSPQLTAHCLILLVVDDEDDQQPPVLYFAHTGKESSTRHPTKEEQLLMMIVECQKDGTCSITPQTRNLCTHANELPMNYSYYVALNFHSSSCAD